MTNDIDYNDMFNEMSKELETDFIPENDKHISIKNITHDELTENSRTSQRKLDCENFKKVDILRWTRDPESIKIDEDGDIHCDAWGNYYIRGTGDVTTTVELINQYIEECHKQKDFRNFDFIELIEKLPEENIEEEDKPLISEDLLKEFL